MNTLDARKALLIVGAMTVHPFTEEVGLGVSFGDGMALGLFITLAIAVHYIPEGLAINLVLVPRGGNLDTPFCVNLPVGEKRPVGWC